MPRELRCPLPDGIWSALAERAAATGEPVAHIVARALADALDVEHHTLFQVSTAGALVQGVYQGAARIATLREHGDFGLGTFEGLDGELVALDGRFLRARADGSVSEAADDALSPYAMVTRLGPGPDADLGPVADLDALCGRLDALRGTDNHFFAVRLEGAFASLHLRAACRVADGTPLDVAAARQSEWRLEDVRGTVVGFWSPDYAARLDVAGYHLHFVDADRRRAGHVLGLGGAEARARVQRLDELVVALPETPGFLGADLRPDPGAALRRAERDDES